ncbi:MAG TPA: MBL fold metallo-hydrolase [Jatrophihabitans sp.]|nr:MBL fold metallo-hydrolase [Jatrophihabitans sp.]
MSYTGRVAVGGPMDVRELPGALIAKLAVGRYDNNVYLIRCTATGAALLIDAAAEADRLVEFSSFDGEPAGSVLTTHLHPDHWQALGALVAQTGARTLAGAADAGGIPVPTDRLLRHGDRVQVGELELAAIELRGHTPGSIALYYQDPEGTGHLFTGDALFPGGVGRTTSPAAFDSLYGDVVSRIFDVYGDDTWFYPGHGNDSTLGTERPQLAEWRERGW